LAEPEMRHPVSLEILVSLETLVSPETLGNLILLIQVSLGTQLLNHHRPEEAPGA
jgi:hypothetical protein